MAKGVNPSQLDGLAANGAFPLCMKTMHLKLRENHHLRHSARIQYGLFLKGIGVSLEDSIEFWKSEFTRKMDSEKFEREHAYTIRHNYGKKGHGVDYSPYGCYKIINDSNPGSSSSFIITITIIIIIIITFVFSFHLFLLSAIHADRFLVALIADEFHGCPFKTFSEKQLRAEVAASGGSASAAQAIIDDIKNHQYQVRVPSLPLLSFVFTRLTTFRFCLDPSGCLSQVL